MDYKQKEDLLVYNILAVIPARGGSKGIPRKNIRFMNGKPLIAYAIENALRCEAITDCVVTTDDAEIAYVAEQFGSYTVPRDSELAKDAVTLDPVIEDATRRMEEKLGKHYDAVVTMQPTSPLLSHETLSGALQKFIEDGVDTIISVVNNPHLSWTKKDGKVLPNYKERLNRQQLPSNYLETGAFLITKRAFVTPESRMGNNISVYEMPEKEATDIDTVADWIVSESELKRKRIVFRADGMKKLGMGHIYNCITMAFNLIEHQVLFVTRKDCIEGLRKIQSTNMPYVTIESDEDIQKVIDDFKPDIWVNDCLNTTATYMRWLKDRVKRVVSIEDLGTGTELADAVINALYENKKVNNDNAYDGARYVCLRDEFQLANQKEFSADVHNVLIMFGGTDPSNLNKKLYKAAKIISKTYPQIEFHFVTGIGYDLQSNGIESDCSRNIYVHSDVSRVTEYMKKADIAVSSQGRTVYEIASMGVPAVIMAQNEREMTHTFATMKNGFLNLGLGKNIDIDTIVNTLHWLIATPNIRKNMRSLMLKYDFKNNMQRIKEIIIGDDE